MRRPDCEEIPFLNYLLEEFQYIKKLFFVIDMFAEVEKIHHASSRWKFCTSSANDLTSQTQECITCYHNLKSKWPHPGHTVEEMKTTRQVNICVVLRFRAKKFVVILAGGTLKKNLIRSIKKQRCGYFKQYGI